MSKCDFMMAVNLFVLWLLWLFGRFGFHPYNSSSRECKVPRKISEKAMRKEEVGTRIKFRLAVLATNTTAKVWNFSHEDIKDVGTIVKPIWTLKYLYHNPPSVCTYVCHAFQCRYAFANFSGFFRIFQLHNLPNFPFITQRASVPPKAVFTRV